MNTPSLTYLLPLVSLCVSTYALRYCVSAAAIGIAAHEFKSYWNRPIANTVVSLIPAASLWVLLAITIIGPLANSFDAMNWQPMSTVKNINI
jgi:hypothetical protein